MILLIILLKVKTKENLFSTKMKISFDDFQYAFNGCSQKSIGNRIVRMFIPSFQSDLRILGPKQRKIFFRDTFGWTNQQVAEVADAFRQIKPPMNFAEFAPW